MFDTIIDRRDLLMTGISALSPKVWLDLDQAELDAAYDQTVFAPNYEQIVGRMRLNSASVRQCLGEPQSFKYGPSTIETLYYYPASVPCAPLHIHVHGGAWRQRKAEGMLFMAEAFVHADIGFAIFDFTSVDENNGDLGPMFDQVCKGLAWFAREAGALGGNPHRLYLSGFSSGAHLASAALVADWGSLGFEQMPYKGALLVSGMYDLHPVRLSARSKYVAFTDEIESAMSAQRHTEKFTVPTILAYGGYESPEFQRQSRDFGAALNRAGKSVQVLKCEDYNHYEMMEMLGHPYSRLGRAAISQARGLPSQN